MMDERVDYVIVPREEAQNARAFAQSALNGGSGIVGDIMAIRDLADRWLATRWLAAPTAPPATATGPSEQTFRRVIRAYVDHATTPRGVIDADAMCAALIAAADDGGGAGE